MNCILPAEASAPFVFNMSVYEYQDNSKLSKLLYGDKGQDKALQKKQADNVRLYNKVIFMVLFLLCRTKLQFDALHYLVYSESPMLYKLTDTIFTVLCLVWVWEVINKALKTFANDVFPESRVFKGAYRFVVKVRPLYPLYFVFCCVISFWYFVDYYGYLLHKFP